MLPWTAINHRKARPATALVAGYHTDFPNAHVHRVGSELFGRFVAGGLRRLSVSYAEMTYREFDRVYTLDDGTRRQLGDYGIGNVDVIDLGVDTSRFSPAHRDPGYRARMNLPGNGPLLVYAGRIDNERFADRLPAMMRHFPTDFGAALVMIGDGKLRDPLMAECTDLPIAFPGFVADRGELAIALASSDIYVSAMPNETFGISVIEAQASGLPVVGINSGAMPARVPPHLGALCEADDPAALAAAVRRVWDADCQGIGAAARHHVAERYTWERTFRRLLDDVYAPALSRAAARQAPVSQPGMSRWRIPA